MAMNWPTFFTRLGSAIVFAIIMMAGLLWNQIAFNVLASLIMVLCLREYFKLVRKINPDTPYPSWMPFFMQVISLGFLWATWAFGVGNALPVMVMLLTLLLLFTALQRNTALQAGLQAIGSIAYIVLPLTMFMLLRRINMELPLALILMIWMNDTMAYIVGSFIGKRPFSEISPKKTWEGTIGGALLTIIGAAVWGYFSYDYTMLDWMMLALCAAVAGTAGDLLESKLKRMANVKDSGTMMPGHGGALDRFDSLLVAVPFAYCYAHFCMPALFIVIF